MELNNQILGKELFEYVNMKPGEETKIANLVWSVFEEFEAPNYKPEGIDEFKKFILPENIKVRYDAGQLFITCRKDDEIVGVISMRDNAHISLLFVKKQYHRLGIARKLFEFAIEKCCKENCNLQSVTVNSSLYAVGIYEKIGFEKSASEQEINGIRFIPMKLTMTW